MCGRAKLTVPFSVLAKLYALEETDAPLLVPRRNIAPTQAIAIVRAVKGGARRMALVRWGLVPSWSKGLEAGAKMFNARSESIATKPSFRAAFRKRRCLVIADGFYEWKTEEGARKQKTPHLVTMPGNAPFAMAGLWETWTSPDGELIDTCTILTREAAGVVKEIHSRMPIILAPECHEAWLDPEVTDSTVVEAMLAAALTEGLHAEVLAGVPSDAANDTAPKPGQLKLFG